MGKARQSKLWDTIRTKTGWKGTKAEFEASMGPIENFEYRGAGGVVLPQPPEKKTKKARVVA